MPDVYDALPPDDAPRGRDEESVFARDANDSLVRREKATRSQFDSAAVVVIDGYPVTVPRAVPKTDAQGNPLRDADGGLIPRNSTIYDAASRLVHDGVWSADELGRRIPVLCHQPHLHPVGVCRMCVVQIQQIKRGEARTERKLLPACQHMIADGMVVTTRAGVEGYNPAAKDAANLPEVERFANMVGRVFVSLAPNHLTQEFNKVDRKGRIYVDTGRNGHSATFAAAYTVRAKPGAPVSAPCTWEEIENGKATPTSFTLRNTPARVKKLGDLWAEMLRRKRSLKKATLKLERMAKALR